MPELLLHRQLALEDNDLRRYAAELGLDRPHFDDDRAGATVAERILRDVEGGTQTGEIVGTPALFVNGVVHRGANDVATLITALAG